MCYLWYPVLCFFSKFKWHKRKPRLDFGLGLGFGLGLSSWTHYTLTFITVCWTMNTSISPLYIHINQLQSSLITYHGIKNVLFRVHVQCTCSASMSRIQVQSPVQSQSPQPSPVFYYTKIKRFDVDLRYFFGMITTITSIYTI